MCSNEQNDPLGQQPAWLCCAVDLTAQVLKYGYTAAHWKPTA
ncbi:hypothetical protein ACIP9X_03185 [Arthrobacter sp. NPDC093125]